MQRTDGLIDTQEVFGRITYVDDHRAEYEVEERVSGKNVLMRINSGGFSLATNPEDLARFSGVTLL